MIALHARRSAGAVARFRAAHPARPLALVLTGTDVYRDIEAIRRRGIRSQCASQLVLLQAEALDAPAATHCGPRRGSILQSASRVLRHDAFALAPATWWRSGTCATRRTR